jgi:NAD(P)-dependent dehydrogenase (short-subunit alcohol dehydrogenase family)
MLDNKVILITGASRGIGRTVAKALAANGASVILLSRTVQDLESLYDEIVQAGYPTPSIYPFNLCTATLEDYDDLRRSIEQQYGRLDGLIHNAGMLGALSPIEHYDIHKWYQVLQVNLNSVFILTQACMQLLKKSAAASIIFTTADVSTTPKANWGAYAVASAGCHTMMQMLASECENLTNIRVNAIKPNKIQTTLRAQAYPAEEQSSLQKPDAIVERYLYLMSDESQHINADVLTTAAL